MPITVVHSLDISDMPESFLIKSTDSSTDKNENWTRKQSITTVIELWLLRRSTTAWQSRADRHGSYNTLQTLASFHYLRAPERIKFKLVDIVYWALHGAAPQYLSDQLQYVVDLPTRRCGHLHSSISNILDVRPSRCVTVGDRSFATASPWLWNSLPADVRSASSLTFRRKLKTHLFRQSYPDIVL